MKRIAIASFSTLVILCLPLLVSAQITSAGSGSWTDGGTWTGGIAPTSVDDVIIQSTHTISVDDDNAVCRNLSFAADDALIDMNANSTLTVYGDMTLSSTAHVAFSAGWSATSAYIRFAGSADQTLSGWNPSGGSTSLRDVIFDKPGGKVTTDGSGMRLGIQNSLEILSGTFELAVGDDIEGRWASSGLFTSNSLPDVMIHAGGEFTMLDGSGVHHIRSGTGIPIGKFTVYGQAEFRDGSTNGIILNGIDVEDGGKLVVSTGIPATEFDCGTITVKSGGEYENYTTTDVWGPSAALVLDTGGLFDTKSSTTIFPASFTNNGTVRYSRDASTDQTVVDMDYYRVEFSFDVDNNKNWSLAADRAIADELELNNSATLVLSAGAPQSLTVGASLRMTSGSIDNSDANVSLTMADGAVITRATGIITSPPVFAGGADVRYVSSVSPVTTGPELPVSSGVLNDLEIVSTQGVTLSADVTVNGACTVSGSDLVTGPYTVTLGPSATLSEADSMTVLGNATTTRTLSQSVNETFGGLGLEVNAAGGAPGVTTVLRVTGTAQSVNSYDGILRYFDVAPANNTGLVATVVFHYDQSELNGIAEGALAMYAIPPSESSWHAQGGVVNESANTVTMSPSNSLALLTLAVEEIPVATLLQDFSAAGGADGIELSWRLWDVDPGVEFMVYRKQEGDASYRLIEADVVAAGELAFKATDRLCEPGVLYRYRVTLLADGEQRTLFETEAVSTRAIATPLALSQNTPNPFNPTTRIAYTVPRQTHVSLVIYDASGRRVANLVDAVQGAGAHQETWEGRDDGGRVVASGVYFYRLTAGGKSMTRKMLLLK